MGVIKNSECLPDQTDAHMDNSHSENVDNGHSATDQVDAQLDKGNSVTPVRQDQDSAAEKYAAAEENAENQVGREKSLPPDNFDPSNKEDGANEDKEAMSTIVAFEDLGKSCDKAQLEELIMLVQAKIAAAKKEKEKKQREINNNIDNTVEEHGIATTFKSKDA